MIQFGGKQLDLEEVIRHVSKKLGASKDDVEDLIANLDSVITEKVHERQDEAKGKVVPESETPPKRLSDDDLDVTFYETSAGKLRRLKNLMFIK